MNLEIAWYAISFLTAFASVLAVTPLTIRIAQKFGIEDKPDGKLKKHTKVTPYLGGLAVVAGFVITFSLLSTTDVIDHRALAVLSGGMMMLFLGLFDDLAAFSPKVKFLGQTVAAAALCKAGIGFDFPILGEWGNIALTILWVTGVTNAFNIIDIMDGLAAGTACVAALFLFVISFALGDAVVPFMAIVLAGSLAGFLRFNFRPARIFLGDAGSLFIGYMMAVLPLLVTFDQNAYSFVTPILICAVPIFDIAFVSFHRTLKGIPIYNGSPDHFVLRLKHRGVSIPATVVGTYHAGAIMGALAVTLVLGPAELAPWVVSAAVGIAMTAATLFSTLPAPGTAAPAPAQSPALAEDSLAA